MRGPYGKLWTELFPSFYGPSAKRARAMKTGKEKTRIHNLPYGPSKRGLVRCLLYGFVDFSGKGTNSFDVLTELEVRTAAYRPGIEQSQHAKSVSHIIQLSPEPLVTDTEGGNCFSICQISEWIWRISVLNALK